jgi:phosphohistidine phosphatase
VSPALGDGRARGGCDDGAVAANDRLNLYLVRHAFASHADPAQWPDDADRPLTEDGARRFRAAARGLRRIVPDVDVVLASGFARAWQTAELLHEAAGWPAPEECPALEAGRPASSLLPILRDRPERSIAVVGHEPHLSMLASLLCAGSEDALNFEVKKGAVALLAFDYAVEPAGARLRWAVAPKILRALDRAGG